MTLVELMVGIVVVIVLAAIALPVVRSARQRSHKAAAVGRLTQLAAASAVYANDHDGALPPEDADGNNSWAAAQSPVNAQVWYNSLPRLAGAKGVGDYAANPKAYYSPENLLYLPGAGYPHSDKKLKSPLFAIAINSKLQRRVGTGKETKVPQVTHPGRTVLFLEQGLPSEHKTESIQAKYEGRAKGTATGFIGRYGGRGLLAFVDGHVESVQPKDLLTVSGQLLRFPDETDICWVRNPEDEPPPQQRSAASGGEKKKKDKKKKDEKKKKGSGPEKNSDGAGSNE